MKKRWRKENGLRRSVSRSLSNGRTMEATPDDSQTTLGLLVKVLYDVDLHESLASVGFTP